MRTWRLLDDAARSSAWNDDTFPYDRRATWCDVCADMARRGCPLDALEQLTFITRLDDVAYFQLAFATHTCDGWYGWLSELRQHAPRLGSITFRSASPAPAEWEAIAARVYDLYQLTVAFADVAPSRRALRLASTTHGAYYSDNAPVFLLGEDRVAHLSRVGGTDGVLTFYPASLHQTFLNCLRSSLYGSAARPYPNARFVRLYWNDVAFAALRADGDVVTWGWDDGSPWSAYAMQSMSTIRGSGTDVTPSSDKPVGPNGGVYHVVPSARSFVGLCLDGSVVCWGGVDSSDVAFQSRVMGMRDCTRVPFATDTEVVLMHRDGTVSCVERVPSVSSASCIAFAEVRAQLTDVRDVHYFSRAGGSFYVARTSRSVVVWGHIVGYAPDVSQRLVRELRGWSRVDSPLAVRDSSQTGQSSWLLQGGSDGQTVVDEREYDRILGVHTTWTSDAPRPTCASGVCARPVAWCASNDVMHAAITADAGVAMWGPVAERSGLSARFVRFRNPSATQSVAFGKWGLYSTYADAVSDHGGDEASCVLNGLWPIHDRITHTATTPTSQTATLSDVLSNPSWDAFPTYFTIEPLGIVTFDLQTSVGFSYIRLGVAPPDVSVAASTNGVQFTSVTMVRSTHPSNLYAAREATSSSQVEYIQAQSPRSVCAVHPMRRGFALVVRRPDADDRGVYWVGNSAANVPVESRSFACEISDQVVIPDVRASYGDGDSLVVFQSSPRRVVWLDQSNADRTPHPRAQLEGGSTRRVVGQLRVLRSERDNVTAFTSPTDVALLTADATTGSYGLQGVSTTHDWSGVCIPRGGLVEAYDRWGNKRVICKHAPFGRFDGWDFTNVDLSDGRFRGGSFRHARLDGAVWSRSDVRDVDFSFATGVVALWDASDVARVTGEQADVRYTRDGFAAMPVHRVVGLHRTALYTSSIQPVALDFAELVRMGRALYTDIWRHMKCSFASHDASGAPLAGGAQVGYAWYWVDDIYRGLAVSDANIPGFREVDDTLNAGMRQLLARIQPSGAIRRVVFTTFDPDDHSRIPAMEFGMVRNPNRQSDTALYTISDLIRTIHPPTVPYVFCQHSTAFLVMNVDWFVAPSPSLQDPRDVVASRHGLPAYFSPSGVDAAGARYVAPYQLRQRSPSQQLVLQWDPKTPFHTTDVGTLVYEVVWTQGDDRTRIPLASVTIERGNTMRIRNVACDRFADATCSVRLWTTRRVASDRVTATIPCQYILPTFSFGAQSSPTDDSARVTEWAVASDALTGGMVHRQRSTIGWSIDDADWRDLVQRQSLVCRRVEIRDDSGVALPHSISSTAVDASGISVVVVPGSFVAGRLTALLYSPVLNWNYRLHCSRRLAVSPAPVVGVPRSGDAQLPPPYTLVGGASVPVICPFEFAGGGRFYGRAASDDVDAVSMLDSSGVSCGVVTSVEYATDARRDIRIWCTTAVSARTAVTIVFQMGGGERRPFPPIPASSVYQLPPDDASSIRTVRTVAYPAMGQVVRFSTALAGRILAHPTLCRSAVSVVDASGQVVATSDVDASGGAVGFSVRVTERTTHLASVRLTVGALTRIYAAGTVLSPAEIYAYPSYIVDASGQTALSQSRPQTATLTLVDGDVSDADRLGEVALYDGVGVSVATDVRLLGRNRVQCRVVPLWASAAARWRVDVRSPDGRDACTVRSLAARPILAKPVALGVRSCLPNSAYTLIHDASSSMICDFGFPSGGSFDRDEAASNFASVRAYPPAYARVTRVGYVDDARRSCILTIACASSDVRTWVGDRLFVLFQLPDRTDVVFSVPHASIYAFPTAPPVVTQSPARSMPDRPARVTLAFATAERLPADVRVTTTALAADGTTTTTSQPACDVSGVFVSWMQAATRHQTIVAGVAMQLGPTRRDYTVLVPMAVYALPRSIDVSASDARVYEADANVVSVVPSDDGTSFDASGAVTIESMYLVDASGASYYDAIQRPALVDGGRRIQCTVVPVYAVGLRIGLTLRPVDDDGAGAPSARYESTRALTVVRSPTAGRVVPIDLPSPYVAAVDASVRVAFEFDFGGDGSFRQADPNDHFADVYLRSASDGARIGSCDRATVQYGDATRRSIRMHLTIPSSATGDVTCVFEMGRGPVRRAIPFSIPSSQIFRFPRCSSFTPESSLPITVGRTAVARATLDRLVPGIRLGADAFARSDASGQACRVDGSGQIVRCSFHVALASAYRLDVTMHFGACSKTTSFPDVVVPAQLFAIPRYQPDARLAWVDASGTSTADDDIRTLSVGRVYTAGAHRWHIAIPEGLGGPSRITSVKMVDATNPQRVVGLSPIPTATSIDSSGNLVVAIQTYYMSAQVASSCQLCVVWQTTTDAVEWSMLSSVVYRVVCTPNAVSVGAIPPTTFALVLGVPVSVPFRLSQSNPSIVCDASGFGAGGVVSHVLAIADRTAVQCRLDDRVVFGSNGTFVVECTALAECVSLSLVLVDTRERIRVEIPNVFKFPPYAPVLYSTRPYAPFVGQRVTFHATWENLASALEFRTVDVTLVPVDSSGGSAGASMSSVGDLRDHQCTFTLENARDVDVDAILSLRVGAYRRDYTIRRVVRKGGVYEAPSTFDMSTPTLAIGQALIPNPIRATLTPSVLIPGWPITYEATFPDYMSGALATYTTASVLDASGRVRSRQPVHVRGDTLSFIVASGLSTASYHAQLSGDAVGDRRNVRLLNFITADRFYRVPSAIDVLRTRISTGFLRQFQPSVVEMALSGGDAVDASGIVDVRAFIETESSTVVGEAVGGSLRVVSDRVVRCTLIPNASTVAPSAWLVLAIRTPDGRTARVRADRGLSISPAPIASPSVIIPSVYLVASAWTSVVFPFLFPSGIDDDAFVCGTPQEQFTSIVVDPSGSGTLDARSLQFVDDRRAVSALFYTHDDATRAGNRTTVSFTMPASSAPISFALRPEQLYRFPTTAFVSSATSAGPRGGSVVTVGTPFTCTLQLVGGSAILPAFGTASLTTGSAAASATLAPSEHVDRASLSCRVLPSGRDASGWDVCFVTYNDVSDGPHRIVGNDFYYNGAFDTPYATGKWVGTNSYAVQVVSWRGWIVMQIASDFTMKTAWSAEGSEYVPTVANITTLTTGKPVLSWTGHLATPVVTGSLTLSVDGASRTLSDIPLLPRALLYKTPPAVVAVVSFVGPSTTREDALIDTLALGGVYGSDGGGDGAVCGPLHTSVVVLHLPQFAGYAVNLEEVMPSGSVRMVDASGGTYGRVGAYTYDAPRHEIRVSSCALGWQMPVGGRVRFAVDLTAPDGARQTVLSNPFAVEPIPTSVRPASIGDTLYVLIAYRSVAVRVQFSGGHADGHSVADVRWSNASVTSSSLESAAGLVLVCTCSHRPTSAVTATLTLARTRARLSWTIDASSIYAFPTSVGLTIVDSPTATGPLVALDLVGGSWGLPSGGTHALTSPTCSFVRSTPTPTPTSVASTSTLLYAAVDDDASATSNAATLVLAFGGAMQEYAVTYVRS